MISYLKCRDGVRKRVNALLSPHFMFLPSNGAKVEGTRGDMIIQLYLQV